jgi:uncharacterized SAM-binding protein YcdF (DUF218 family)
MQFLKKSVEIIFSPVGITTILIGSGIVLSFTKKHIGAGRRLLISGGFIFLVLLFSPVSEYMVLRLEKEYPPMLIPPKSPKIERIVILAGYAEENRGFPITTNVSERTICTVTEGLRLYRLLPGAKLIVSGGVVRKRERPVATAMSELIQALGVPAQDIQVEGNSRNTYENLLGVQAIIGNRPFILITQACDMRRAMAISRKLGMNAVPAPACNWVLQYHMGNTLSREIAKYFESFLYPSLENFSRAQWAFHEYVGYYWYRLLNRI